MSTRYGRDPRDLWSNLRRLRSTLSNWRVLHPLCGTGGILVPEVLEMEATKTLLLSARGRSQIHFEGKLLPLWETKPSVPTSGEGRSCSGRGSGHVQSRAPSSSFLLCRQERGGVIRGQGPFWLRWSPCLSSRSGPQAAELRDSQEIDVVLLGISIPHRN